MELHVNFTTVVECHVVRELTAGLVNGTKEFLYDSSANRLSLPLSF